MNIISEILETASGIKNWALDIKQCGLTVEDGVFGFNSNDSNAFFFYDGIDNNNEHYKSCDKIMSYKAARMFSQSPLDYC